MYSHIQGAQVWLLQLCPSVFRGFSIWAIPAERERKVTGEGKEAWSGDANTTFLAVQRNPDKHSCQYIRPRVGPR